MSHILTIDIGTTNIKAGVVSPDGKIQALARRTNEMERPIRRAAEHDPQKLWKNVIEACREVTSEYRDTISAISASTYQFGLLLLDQSMEPLTGLTTLVDTRARLTHNQFLESADTYSLYKNTGCPPFFQFPLSRLFYFREQEPEIFKKARYALSGKSYLLWKLTGEMITDPSTDSASQMLNIHNLSWDTDALGTVGIDHISLPEVMEPTQELLNLKDGVADELGVNSDVKIIPGVYDSAALILATGSISASQGCVNVGTTGMFRVALDQPILDHDPAMRFQTYYFMNKTYLIGGGINNAVLPLKWCKENLFTEEEIPALLDHDSAAKIGSRKLFFLPYLTGERDWQIGNEASGVMFGLREYHTKSEMVRCILEGVAYSLRFIKEALEDNNINLREINIGGGGTKHPEWVSILSAVLNCPMNRTQSREACLIGNAMLGFSATGYYKDLDEALANMQAKSEPVPSNSAGAEEYNRYYEFYKELYGGLKDLYKKHAAFNY